MSDEDSGDEHPDEDAPEGDLEPVTEEALRDRLATIEEQLDAAETEADLDEVESEIDDLETKVEAADLPEPDDEEEEPPAEEIEAELESLTEDLEAARGPYAEDVAAELEAASDAIEAGEWTETGESELVDATDAFLGSAGDTLEESLEREGDDPGALRAAISEAADAVTDAGLDPDEDAEAIAGLLEAAETLGDAIEDAEEWDDLSVREKLDAEGFYDVLEHRKDFPPELNAVKVYEKRGEAEPILRAYEMLDSDFMEDRCMQALRKLGPEAAIDPMKQKAQRRDTDAVEILGKIGSDEPLDMLLDYTDADSNRQLQTATLKALGEIGSQEATQPVADQLAADNASVRSQAARALGMIGDTRAIGPLADVLADDEDDTVRASAAWALNQIGTERALEEVREYADDRAYLVQNEAEKVV